MKDNIICTDAYKKWINGLSENNFDRLTITVESDEELDAVKAYYTGDFLDYMTMTCYLISGVINILPDDLSYKIKASGMDLNDFALKLITRWHKAVRPLIDETCQNMEDTKPVNMNYLLSRFEYPDEYEIHPVILEAIEQLIEKELAKQKGRSR